MLILLCIRTTIELNDVKKLSTLRTLFTFPRNKNRENIIKIIRAIVVIGAPVMAMSPIQRYADTLR